MYVCMYVCKIEFSGENSTYLLGTADRLAQLVEHRTAVREVKGSDLGRTNTQGLKITEENVLPL